MSELFTKYNFSSRAENNPQEGDWASLHPFCSPHCAGVPSLLLVTHLTASDEGRRENQVTALSHIEGVAGSLGQDLNPSLRDLRSCHCASLTRENSLC